MEEVTIEDCIDDMVSEKTIDARALLAARAKELIAESGGQHDFDSMVINNLHRDIDLLKSDNQKLISIAHAMSKKI